jgi:GTPase SAR1 family protein
MEAAEELEDVECKVVLVGDSRCGKTALVQRFVGDNFVEVGIRPSL